MQAVTADVSAENPGFRALGLCESRIAVPSYIARTNE